MLRRLGREEFDTVFEIMETSFPQDEHRTYEEQKALLDQTAYEIYIESDGAEIKAFMAVWNFDSVVFIEHFAVHPAYRNHGIGGTLLRELVYAVGKLVCLEVELPNDEMTAQRIGFYERNQFFLNDYPYIQPSISAGRNPVPLLIMTSGWPISRAEFEKIKDVLYKEVYKQY